MATGPYNFEQTTRNSQMNFPDLSYYRVNSALIQSDLDCAVQSRAVDSYRQEVCCQTHLHVANV